MPQPERTEKIRQIMLWLLAKSKSSGGASMHELLIHTLEEVCDLGATQRTVAGYIQTLKQGHFLSVGKGSRIMLSEKGKDWLKRRGSI